jgi:hypothetical protein
MTVTCGEQFPYLVISSPLRVTLIFTLPRRVASAVKAESPSTPVVLLTGWGRRMAAERDVPPHVDRVLSKPPDPSALRDVIAGCAAIER